MMHDFSEACMLVMHHLMNDACSCCTIPPNIHLGTYVMTSRHMLQCQEVANELLRLPCIHIPTGTRACITLGGGTHARAEDKRDSQHAITSAEAKDQG
jgi:hypothetical protein